MRDRGNTSETGRENEPGQSPESDLLPVLKGWFSSPLQAVHQFPHLFAYIYHLRAVRRPELPQEPIIPGSKALF